MIREVQTPFDLQRGPLARGRLLRMAPDDHVLLITLHHIISDGWSISILTRELSALYAAFKRGERAPLQPLKIQYVDYAAWQRQWLSEKRVSEHLDYWGHVLAGAPPLLELPTDRPRPAQQRFDGSVVAVELDEELTAGLKTLSQRYGMTLFMTLLTAWATVLSRLSGQDDLLIGTPTANRTHTEIEGLIGLFVNTLALRVSFSDDPTIEEVLLRTRGACLEAQEHQDLPFEQVVELINPKRSTAYTPLFQVMFAWENTETETFDLPGLEVEQIDTPTTTAKYALTLGLTELRGRIVGELNFSTALFDATTAQRYVSYLRLVLAQMSADVLKPVAALELLTAHERHQLVVTWNETAVEYPTERCIHELFEEQVQRTPDAVAVSCASESLTYAELNEKANRLARYLRKFGVGPNQLVALCVERGVAMVVGLLGILKAGGAYVPLDTAYPAERLLYLLRDAAPRVLLTQDRLKRSLPPTAAKVIAMDGDWSRIAEQEADNLATRSIALTSRHLAYVIYTSGSTGATQRRRD